MRVDLGLLGPVAGLLDDDCEVGGNPFEEYWDCAHGFVVWAASEGGARRVAATACGDERRRAWLDSRWSTCERLTGAGRSGVVLRDFCRG